MLQIVDTIGTLPENIKCMQDQLKIKVGVLQRNMRMKIIKNMFEAQIDQVYENFRKQTAKNIFKTVVRTILKCH